MKSEIASKISDSYTIWSKYYVTMLRDLKQSKIYGANKTIPLSSIVDSLLDQSAHKINGLGF